MNEGWSLWAVSGEAGCSLQLDREPGSGTREGREQGGQAGQGTGLVGFEWQEQGCGRLWTFWFVLSVEGDRGDRNAGKMAAFAGRRQVKGPDEQQAEGPRADLLPPLVFLPQLFPSQLTLAPRFLPNTLISVDFAANYLTKIYGLTFGQKPNLRSEVRGGALGSGWGRGRS